MSYWRWICLVFVPLAVVLLVGTKFGLSAIGMQHDDVDGLVVVVALVLAFVSGERYGRTADD